MLIHVSEELSPFSQMKDKPAVSYVSLKYEWTCAGLYSVTFQKMVPITLITVLKSNNIFDISE
jgi:hypothetical protein